MAWLTTRGLDITDGIADSSTKMRKQTTSTAKEFVIHTSSEEQEEILKLKKTETDVKHNEMKNNENDGEDTGSSSQRSKKTHSVAFNFVSSFFDILEYFVVRGQKRRGLLIDPGAASGLIGSETLRDLLETCVDPHAGQDRYEIRFDRTSPVSGISGSSDRTLGQSDHPLADEWPCNLLHRRGFGRTRKFVPSLGRQSCLAKHEQRDLHQLL